MNDRGFLSRFARRDPDSIRKRALAHDEGQNFVKSTPLWRQLAESGDPEACLTLAERHELVAARSRISSRRRAGFTRRLNTGWSPPRPSLANIYLHGRAAPTSVSPAGTASEAGGEVKAAGAFTRLFPRGSPFKPRSCRGGEMEPARRPGGRYVGPGAAGLSVRYGPGSGARLR